MKKVYVLILLCFIANGYADDLPDLGDSSATALSPVEERRIADSILRDVMSSNEVITDPEIVDYVQNLGQKLVNSSPGRFDSFNFFVVNDQSINAFAMPGAIIGVHTGLIVAAENEDEVASVLGHEIGHVVQHHLARMLAQQKRDSFFNLAGMGLALLAARANPELSQAAFTTSAAAGIQRQLDFTRDHEREADRVGLDILNKAGFDARAMPSFFEILQKGSRFSEGGAPSFLRTHPLTSERIADVKNRVDQFAFRASKASEDFGFIRAKILASQGNAIDAIALFKANIAELTVNSTANSATSSTENVATNTTEYLAANHYGLAVAVMRANDIKTANAAFNAIQLNTKNSYTSQLGADIAMAQKNYPLAQQRYQTALSTYPSARSLIFGYANLLITLNKLQQSIDFIKEKQTVLTHDAMLYELLSRAYTLQGRELLRHQAQAEAYYRRYNLPAAIGQMDLAVRAGDGDFYQKSSVEARLKEFKLQVTAPDS